MRPAIDAKPPELDRRLALAHLTLAAAQNGLNAQEELAHAEWLHHVVVRAELEADDAIDLLTFGRQHHHGNSASRRTFLELLTDLRARHVGKHQVEQDEIRSLFASEAESLGSEIRHDGVVACLLEVVCKDLLKILLVFDH